MFQMSITCTAHNLCIYITQCLISISSPLENPNQNILTIPGDRSTYGGHACIKSASLNINVQLFRAVRELILV